MTMCSLCYTNACKCCLLLQTSQSLTLTYPACCVYGTALGPIWACSQAKVSLLKVNLRALTITWDRKPAREQTGQVLTPSGVGVLSLVGPFYTTTGWAR